MLLNRLDSQPSPGLVFESGSGANAGDGRVRRLFVIWNRGYKTQLVIAETAQEALRISCDSKHIRRLDGYRKFLDTTDEQLNSQDDGETLLAALNAGRSGVAEHIEGDGWIIDGVKVS